MIKDRGHESGKDTLLTSYGISYILINKRDIWFKLVGADISEDEFEIVQYTTEVVSSLIYINFADLTKGTANKAYVSLKKMIDVILDIATKEAKTGNYGKYPEQIRAIFERYDVYMNTVKLDPFKLSLQIHSCVIDNLNSRLHSEEWGCEIYKLITNEKSSFNINTITLPELKEYIGFIVKTAKQQFKDIQTAHDDFIKMKQNTK